jgi:lysophospholipase L1-like esterase
VERFVFSACSGAVTDDWPAHRDRWTDGRPNLITATYGGNDIGFTDVVLDCIGVDDGVDVVAELERTERLTQIDLGSVADTLLNRGCDLSEAEVQQRIDGLRSRLEALYGEMSDLVGPEGWVLILGYPSPVADPDAWDANRCDGVATDDGRLLRRAAQRLNGVISSSTDVRDNVRFVDVAPVFEGHGRCSGDDWIFGLADSIDDERTSIGNLPAVETMRPFHPNQAGHRAMAETLRRALDAELS